MEGAKGTVHIVLQEAFWAELVAKHCLNVVVLRPSRGVLGFEGFQV